MGLQVHHSLDIQNAHFMVSLISFVLFLARGYMVLRELLCIILYLFGGNPDLSDSENMRVYISPPIFTSRFVYWSTECICLRANRGGNLAIFIVLVVNVFILAKLRTTY